MEVSTSHPTPKTKQPTDHDQVQHTEEEQLRSLRKARDQGSDKNH